jgi:hypothetical protein
VPNREYKPPGSFQKRRREKPSADVGMMKGIFVKESRTPSHLDFPLTMSQAIGTPTRRSTVDTMEANTNEFKIAEFALLNKAGSLRMLPIVPPSDTIPRIGGRSMRPKKKATESP